MSGPSAFNFKKTGHEALIVMLKGNIYSPKTLRAALEYYEPKKKDYIDIVTQKKDLIPKERSNH